MEDHLDGRSLCVAACFCSVTKRDATALQYAATYIAQVLHSTRPWPRDLMKSATWYPSDFVSE